MLIQIEDTQSDVKLDANWVSAIVTAVLRKEKEVAAEVYIHFVDTSAICALHEQYFQDPSITDCISFPLDAYREIAHYLIHGLLHLVGHEDLSVKGRAKMRRKERSHLKHVEELGLLPHC